MAERAKRLSLLGLRGDKGRDPEVTGIAVDSRQIRPGFLFAALPGSAQHGGEFIQYALRQGAVAVLTDRKGAEIAAAEAERLEDLLRLQAQREARKAKQ